MRPEVSRQFVLLSIVSNPDSAILCEQAELGMRKGGSYIPAIPA